MPKKTELLNMNNPKAKKRGRPTKYSMLTDQTDLSALSAFDLQRKIGHRIRQPLISIVEQADKLLSADKQNETSDIKAALGLISGSAHQGLDMYDWVLALFALTLLPGDVTTIRPSQFIRALWTIPG